MRLDHLLSRETRVVGKTALLPRSVRSEKTVKIKRLQQEAKPEEDRQRAGEKSEKKFDCASKIVSVSF